MRRRAAWWAIGLGSLGCLGLLAASVLAPDLLVRFSPVGGLSTTFIERLRDVRALAATLGCLLLLVASWRGGWRGALVALTGLIWVGALVNQLYPNHLIRRPQALLDAVLGEELLLRDYDPRPHLTVPAHPVTRARYPVINIHAHFRRWKPVWTAEQLIGFMDACNIERIVDLDGGLGERFAEEIQSYAARYPERFIIFATFPFSEKMKWGLFPERIAQLAEAKRLGARGIKIWKNLGLRTRDEHKQLVPIDDPRVDALWAKAGELGLPILIHVADLPANFDPLDRHNERYEFLKGQMELAYHGPAAPSPLQLLEQFERVVSRHPDVTFILAHLGNRSDDLAAAGAMLDRHPNLYMDVSARIQELGRQPHTARAFLIRYQNRLLFGTDGNPETEDYRTHFRFFETADEYFDYPFWSLFNYGRWKIYGVDLPDDVLRKLYHDNAARLLGLPLLAEQEGQ